jgi:hypothetical protein
MWVGPNAWREVLARVFDGFEMVENIAPEWLVNPATNRRLKLDLFYPQARVAVRFRGLPIRQRRQRPSEEEVRAQETRDDARTDICRAQGISLVNIDAVDADPRLVLGDLRMALARAARQVVQGELAAAEKTALTRKIAKAQAQLESIARNIRRPEDMAIYAELWEDRLYAGAGPEVREPGTVSVHRYQVGMSVRHTTFGEGKVLAVEPNTNDTFVVVRFADGVERKFAASLVEDKLVPQDHRPPR